MYKVLIADDEPYVIEGLQLMVDWDKYGFTIAGTAMSGAEALSSINTLKPDLIVVDIKMPGMNGIELVKAATEQGYRGSIMILTGYTEADYARSVMKYGVKHFVNKPVDPEEIHEALAEIRRELDKKDKLKGGISRNEGLAAAGRRGALSKSGSVKSPSGVMVVFMGGKLLEEEMLTENVRVYGRYNEFIGLVIENAADYDNASKGLFDRLKEIYPDIIAVKSTLNNMSIDECIEACIDCLFRILEPKKGTLYSYRTTAHRRIDPLTIAHYADNIMSETELLSSEKAGKLIDEFFELISEAEAAESVGTVFTSYILVRFSKLIIKCGGKPDKVLRGKLNFENAPFRGLYIYRKAVKEMCDETIRCQREMRRENDGELFDIVEKYIREHYKEQIYIQDIAKQMYTSPGYLGTIFSKRMGISIKEYIHAIRMEEAVRLMNETDMTLSEIAYSIGYNNYNNFYNRFERFFGVTPKEYRKTI